MFIIDKSEAENGGVYLILDIVNWEVYIGETQDLERRAKNYKHDLRRDQGDANKKLHDSFNNNHGLLWNVALYNIDDKKGNAEYGTMVFSNYQDIESFYIALLKEKGFHVYNNRKKEVLMEQMVAKAQADEDMKYLLAHADVALDADFRRRFGFGVDDLREQNKEKRRIIWDKFVEHVINSIENNSNGCPYEIVEKSDSSAGEFNS